MSAAEMGTKLGSGTGVASMVVVRVVVVRVVGMVEVTAMEEGAGVAALAVPEYNSEEEGLEVVLAVEAMAAAARAREATAWGAEGATG
jgi:hypothetical protein